KPPGPYAMRIRALEGRRTGAPVRRPSRAEKVLAPISRWFLHQLISAVPPGRKPGRRTLRLILLPNIEFQFPPLLSVARDAPQFKRADVGDAALQSHRQHRLFLSVNFERHFERA